MRRWLGLIVLVYFAGSPALAVSREARIPLHDGKFETAALSRALLENLHLKGYSLNAGTIDLGMLNGLPIDHTSDLATITAAIDETVRRNGWLIASAMPGRQSLGLR